MAYDHIDKEYCIAVIKKMQSQIDAFAEADEISITPAFLDEDWEPTTTGDPVWLRDVGTSCESTSFARAVCDIIIPYLRRRLESAKQSLAAAILHEREESALDEEYGEPSRINPLWISPTAFPQRVVVPADGS